MENIVLTQLSIPELKNIMRESLPEIKKIFREEIEDFFKKNLLFEKSAEIQDIGGIELAMAVTGLARQTIYARTSDGTIPCWKKNGRVYFSRKDLLEWINKDKNNN